MNRGETPPSRALVLGVLWVAYLLNYVDRQMAFTWFPVLRHDVGFSDTQLGLIGSVFLWTYSICAPFGGRICDRYSRRAIITASIAGWSLATIGTGLSRSPATFLFWRGVVGLTEGFYYPAAVSTLVQVFGNALRGRAIALHGIAQFAGITLGGWLGGLAADRWDWRSACFAVGICGFLYSPIVRGGLRGVREQQTGSGSHALAKLRWSTCLSAIGASFFLICAMLWMLYAWLPDVIHSRFSLSLAASGLNATLVLQLSSMTGLLSGGAIGDWGRERHVEARGYMVAIGLVLCAPFAWLCFSATSLPMLWFAEGAFGLTSGLMLSNVVAGAYDLVPQSQYGTIAGLMTLIGGLGGGLSMLATGVWLTRSTPDVLMRWTSLACIIASIVLAIVVAKRFSIEVAESPSG